MSVNTALTTERTPHIIATEINSIKSQTRVIMLQASIEIGRRLVEAKALVPHGEWGNWLEREVDYSQRTAQNLIRIYEEYGNKQIGIFDAVNSQALADLTYTQAVALLGIPVEERAQFVKEHDLNSMSTRELQQAIKERDEALKEKEKIAKKLESAEHSYKAISESYTRLEKTNSEHYQKAYNLEKELTELKAQLEKAKESGASDEKVKQLEAELKKAKERVKELTEQVNAPVTMEPTVVEKVPEEIEKELSELREKAKNGQQNTAVVKFEMCFDAVVKGFKDLLGALSEIKETAPDKHEKYTNAVLALFDKMAQRL